MDLYKHVSITATRFEVEELLIKKLKTNADLLAALDDCCDRMERARGILQDPRKGNWGMLDTATARAAIAKAKGELHGIPIKTR